MALELWALETTLRIKSLTLRMEWRCLDELVLWLERHSLHITNHADSKDVEGAERGFSTGVVPRPWLALGSAGLLPRHFPHPTDRENGWRGMRSFTAAPSALSSCRCPVSSMSVWEEWVIVLPEFLSLVSWPQEKPSPLMQVVFKYRLLAILKTFLSKSPVGGIVPNLASASLFLQFCGILWLVLTHHNWIFSHNKELSICSFHTDSR